MSFSGRFVAAPVIAIGIVHAGPGPAAAETGSLAIVSSMTGNYTTIAYMGGRILGGG